MGKRPPWYLYQSFLVLSVFVHDAPNKGTHPPVMHLTSLESHHSQDLCEAPSFLCRHFTLGCFPKQHICLRLRYKNIVFQ